VLGIFEKAIALDPENATGRSPIWTSTAGGARHLDVTGARRWR
jgi:hypothetical protein